MPVQPSPDKPLLKIRKLRTIFRTSKREARALDSLDLDIFPGEIVGLVGESGSGKTVTALSILGLIRPPGEVEAEEMTFDGIDLRSLSEDGWARLRGSRIALIFQDPKVRLNPVFSIGTQLAETIEIHHGMSRQESWSRMLALLRDVRLPGAESKAYAYPHELSVGQAQRVMIAMALALEPELIIADEPTSALDATIQAQILNLLESQYQRDAGAVLLISHNLAIVAELAKRVIVLYTGHVVEQASAEALFQNPFHPYTQGLIASMPQNQVPDKRMYSIAGRIPDAQDLPRGCRFHPRCDARKQYQLAICERETPELQLVEPDHHVRCWLYQSQGDHTAPFPEGPVATPDESMDAD